MNSRLVEKSCIGFADVLASKASVPGGGGAAALVGALGVALCAMVGNFTVGKKKYARHESDVKAMLEKAEKLRARFLKLVDDDAAAFAPLSRAYAIPRDDPDHDRLLEEAAHNACRAPVEMVERCGEAIELLEEMLEKGSAMLASDVGCGALMCRAAMESAAMNVYINTASLKNRTVANLLEEKMDGLLSTYTCRADAVARAVLQRIRKEG